MNLTEFVDIGARNGMCQVTMSRLDDSHVALYITSVAGGDEPKMVSDTVVCHDLSTALSEISKAMMKSLFPAANPLSETQDTEYWKRGGNQGGMKGGNA